jgi:hydrocephalus-inducing protein
MQVVYADNPQRDSVDLLGIMDYPNLALSTTSVEFGSCLSDTARRVPITITNTSAVDVVYSWAWDRDSMREDANSIASLSMKQARQPKPPAVQLFDILPVNGVLRPGETETITCAFFAFPGVKASATAMCLVEGGPTYQVSMSGESNNIKYNVEPQFVDMGQQLYNKSVDKEVVIANQVGSWSQQELHRGFSWSSQACDQLLVSGHPTAENAENVSVHLLSLQGKVPFDFSLNMRLLSRPSIIQAYPRTGTVAPGQKETVKLRICAGVPDRLLETVLVELAHFDPIPIQVKRGLGLCCRWFLHHMRIQQMAGHCIHTRMPVMTHHWHDNSC